MAQIIDLKARGLVTHPNRLGLPPGSMVVANNITIDKEDVIDTHRGSKHYGDDLGAAPSKLFQFRDRLIVHHGTTLEYDSDGAGTWSAYSGSYSAPSGRKIQSFRSNSNFYFTSSVGLQKLDTLTGTPALAGMAKALDGEAALASAGSGWFAVDGQVAYRVIWGIEDANENLILGAPSQRIRLANPAAGAADDVDITITIPDGIGTNHFYQLYRSGQSATDATEADDELQLVLERNPTSAEISAGYLTVTDQTPDALRGATLYTSPSQEGIQNSNDNPPLAKDCAVFKDHALYVNTETKQRYWLTLITVGTPNIDAYTNTANTTDTSTTLSSIASMTGLHAGMKVSGTGIPADTYLASVDVGASTAEMTNAATATASGVSILWQDTITIDGVAYHAGGSYNLSSSQFQVYTAGTPADNIEDTSKSLVKLINRSSADIYAFYVSGFDDLPGQILIEDRSLGGASWAVTSSATEAFSPVLPSSGTDESSSNEAKKNRVYIAKPKQPEAVPILQYVDVGSADDEIVRVLALRDSAFYLKENEGVWRMTGEDVNTFVVDDFDRSASIRGAETAVVLNNQGWCFSTQGVVSIADNGVQVWSRNIEEELLIAGSLSNFDSLAFAYSYETERKYYLYFPTLSSDTYCTRSRVYNTFTSAWTGQTYNRTCGIVLEGDNKSYVGQADANYVRQERKTYTVEDYAENEYAVTITGFTGTTVNLSSTSDCSVGQTLQQDSVNRVALISEVTDGTTLQVDRIQSWDSAAAKVFDPVDVDIEWAPIHGGNPGILKQFSEITGFIRNARFTDLDISFASNFSEAGQTTSLEPTTLGAWGAGKWGGFPWGGGSPADQPLRTYIPLEQQRGHWLLTYLEHNEALSNIGLEGLSLIVNQMDTRFNG